MLRDLLKDGGLYTLANLLTKGIGLFLIPFYTTYFSTAEYGVRDILMVFGLFAGNIVSLQLNQGMARYVSEPSVKNDDKKQYASTATLTIVGLFTFFTIFCFIFSTEIVNLLSSNHDISVDTFRLATIAIVFNNIFYFLNVYLRFLRQSKTVSGISFAHAILGVVLMFLFVFYFDMGIDSIFLPFVIIVPLLIGVQLYLLKDQLVLSFKRKYLKTMLSYSVPMLGGALSIVTMSFTDRIFINQMIGTDSLGIYSLGSQFASIIGIVIAGFSAAMGPIIMEKHNRASTRKELQRFFMLFIGIGTSGALMLSIFSSELTAVFASASYQSADAVMPMLFFTVLFTGLSMFAPGLAIHMKTKTIAVLTIFFALLNIGLNFYFVPKWGIVGAASSTLISTALYQVIYFILAQKKYAYRLQIKPITIVLLTLLAILLINFFVKPQEYGLEILMKILLLIMYISIAYHFIIKQYVVSIFANK